PSYGQHNTSSHPSKSISVISERKSRALPPGDSAKVCIAGGSGFIASHITKHLREAGYKITASTGKRMSSRRRREDEFCDEFILDNLHELKSVQGLLAGGYGRYGFHLLQSVSLEFQQHLLLHEYARYFCWDDATREKHQGEEINSTIN
ncbi:hypothetical protein ACHAXN_000185, partial [Cyclotella atomus]